MVTIIDPHIKRDNNYRVYKDAKVYIFSSIYGYLMSITIKNLIFQDMELYVKRADNTTDFDGHCWPGTSEYLDFFNPKVRIVNA